MRSDRARFLSLTATAAVLAMVLAACSSSGGSSSSPSASASASASAAKTPITVGISLSLTGDFSADGQAFQRGYELWQSAVNSHGGILGRQVKLIVINDGSSPTTVVSNYQKLISVDHVDLTFGPFSSLLTGPASTAVARYGYAMIEGAGTSPSVFNVASNQAVHNVFSPSLPVRDYMVPFSDWIKSLPPSQRPKTAAYPMANDPFADPPVQRTQKALEAIGVKTVYSKIFPAEVSAYKAPADQVAASGAQAVVLGSTDIPTVNAFIQAFEQQHYNPKIFIAASGPDQGAAFIKAVGKSNANGMMVPNGWYGGYNNALSHIMVQQYIAKDAIGHQRGCGRGLLRRRGRGAGRHGHRRHQQLQDHQLSAQRGHAGHRAGTGEVQRTRREPAGRRVHLPVAERQIRPGTAARLVGRGKDYQPEAPLGQLISRGWGGRPASLAARPLAFAGLCMSSEGGTGG
jgi:branched-chain amino acid transport system substrate-binding protein